MIRYGKPTNSLCGRLPTRGLLLLLVSLLAATIAVSQDRNEPIVYVRHLEAPLTYPGVARQAHIQGTVVLKVKIAPEGNILSVESSPDVHVAAHPLLREDAERVVKNWTFGCVNCPLNEPFEKTIKFKYRLRDGGIPYDDSTVVMNLPDEITITTTPPQCDHCPREIPEWCKSLPRREYESLHRVSFRNEWWFEVYKVARNTFAIYEPHQSEETISYLILGKEKALLFDTGMGISDIRKLVTELTKLPVIVLNSHTHNDHVGGNWQFDTIYSMDTDFSRQNAKGSTADAQEEIAFGQICGNLPQFFNGRDYRTNAWTITKYVHDGDSLDLGGRSIEILSTPGHTPDAISLFDRSNGLLFTGDTYYPARIWLYRPETDLEAYAKSIARLAALAPQAKLVLGAHNIPVARPSVLPDLVAAFAALRAGKAVCHQVDTAKQDCSIQGFSFFLRAAP